MDWYKVESTIRPSDTDTESSEIYNYVRKNITEEIKDDVTYYVYDEAKIPKESWGIYEELVATQDALDYLIMN